MPDRLPSLILLIGCWVPAAMAGRAAAEIVHRRANRVRPAVVRGGLAAFVIASAAFWFFISLIEVPPYLPGATTDPTYAPPETVRALAIFTSALVLPVSAIACWVSFRMRVRTLMRTGALALLWASAATVAAAQTPNPTNLWLVGLRWTNGTLSTTAPVKLTSDNGTNSQPAFSPDGKAVIFSTTRDTGATARSDIYRITLATRVETRITHTPENENSPTVNENGEYVAVRWNPVTLFKEFGPWIYTSSGEPARGVLRAPDTTGYYTPLPNGHYALTRPKSKSFTLGIFDAQSGMIVDVDSGLPALPAIRIPGEQALSYVQIDSVDAKHVIRRFDLTSRRTSTIGRSVTGRTAHAWIPGHRTLLMAKGNQLFARTLADTAWRVVATFADHDLRNASAYVVSAQGDKLILTSPKRLAFATVLRDSLEAGRSGRHVAEFATQAIRSGTLKDVDIVEGPISALGDDRMQKKRFADGVAIHALATSLFPSSFRAMGRLGDAQMAAGDVAAALTSFKRALDLNPRASDADKAAAEAIERKISGRPPDPTQRQSR